MLHFVVLEASMGDPCYNSDDMEIRNAKPSQWHRSVIPEEGFSRFFVSYFEKGAALVAPAGCISL